MIMMIWWGHRKDDGVRRRKTINTFKNWRPSCKWKVVKVPKRGYGGPGGVSFCQNSPFSQMTILTVPYYSRTGHFDRVGIHWIPAVSTWVMNGSELPNLHMVFLPVHTRIFRFRGKEDWKGNHILDSLLPSVTFITFYFQLGCSY